MKIFEVFMQKNTITVLFLAQILLGLTILGLIPSENNQKVTEEVSVESVKVKTNIEELTDKEKRKFFNPEDNKLRDFESCDDFPDLLYSIVYTQSADSNDYRSTTFCIYEDFGVRSYKEVQSWVVVSEEIKFLDHGSLGIYQLDMILESRGIELGEFNKFSGHNGTCTNGYILRDNRVSKQGTFEKTCTRNPDAEYNSWMVKGDIDGLIDDLESNFEKSYITDLSKLNSVLDQDFDPYLGGSYIDIKYDREDIYKDLINFDLYGESSQGLYDYSNKVAYDGTVITRDARDEQKVFITIPGSSISEGIFIEGNKCFDDYCLYVVAEGQVENSINNNYFRTFAGPIQGYSYALVYVSLEENLVSIDWHEPVGNWGKDGYGADTILILDDNVVIDGTSGISSTPVVRAEVKYFKYNSKGASKILDHDYSDFCTYKTLDGEDYDDYKSCKEMKRDFIISQWPLSFKLLSEEVVVYEYQVK